MTSATNIRFGVLLAASLSLGACGPLEKMNSFKPEGFEAPRSWPHPQKSAAVTIPAAATTETLALIGSISDNYEEDDLNEIALKLASLPGAKAASLLVEFPRFGGPMLVESTPTAAMPIDEFTSQRIGPVDRDGTLSLSV